MKIAFILPNLSKNGPIIYTKYLIDGLKKNVRDIDIYCFDDTNKVEFYGINIKKINFFTKNDFSKYDIVHTHTAKADLFGLLNYNKIKHKWVITTHNLYKKDLDMLYHPIKAKAFAFIWKLAFKYCNNIVVFSESMRKYYKSELGNKNYAVIRTGVPVVEKKEIKLQEKILIENLKNKYTIIGASGHLIKRKGYHQLVSFLSNNDNFAVVITGNGVEKENLLYLAKKLGVKNRLLLLGFKDNPIDYYKYYDIYALPSYAEGLPLSLLEAMESELPIVCSKLENYKEHFSNKDVCFFELDNLDSLAKAILKAVDNENYLKIKSKENYINKFSVEIMAARHIKYYNEVINK